MYSKMIQGDNICDFDVSPKMMKEKFQEPEHERGNNNRNKCRRAFGSETTVTQDVNRSRGETFKNFTIIRFSFLRYPLVLISSSTTHE